MGMELRSWQQGMSGPPLRGALWLPARIILVDNAYSRQFDSREFHRLLTVRMQGDEMRALRRLLRESKPSSFVFVSSRCAPFTTAGFARMFERAARRGPPA